MVEQLIQAIYNTKKWHFIPLLQIYSDLNGIQSKEETRKELNDLFKAGKIIKRKGINGDLIEVIDKNRKI